MHNQKLRLPFYFASSFIRQLIKIFRQHYYLVAPISCLVLFLMLICFVLWDITKYSTQYPVNNKQTAQSDLSNTTAASLISPKQTLNIKRKTNINSIDPTEVPLSNTQTAPILSSRAQTTNIGQLPLFVGTPFFYKPLHHTELSTSSKGIANSSYTQSSMTWLFSGLLCFGLWGIWSLHCYIRQHIQQKRAFHDQTLLKQAVENAILVGLEAIDRKGQIIYSNPTFSRMTGWSEQELLGRFPPYPYWHSEDTVSMMHQFHLMLRGQLSAQGFEMRVVCKDNRCFYGQILTSPLINTAGMHTGWIISLIDISETKRIRETLAAMHKRFIKILENLNICVSIFNLSQEKLLFTNRYYRELFNFCSENTSTGYKALASDLKEFKQLSVKEVFLPHYKKWFEVRHQMIEWVDGELAYLQLATDITSRYLAKETARKQEEKLQFVSRLMTMGELASSLAHELNQPLTAINNYCMGAAALIKSHHFPNEDLLLPALEKASKQAVRAGIIIKRIRSFVQRSEPKKQAVSLKLLIDEAIDITEIESKKQNILIKTFIPNHLPLIYIDPTLIKQVLINLFKNAFDAMQKIKSDTRVPDKISELFIWIYVYRFNQSMRIDVVDQGCGINKKMDGQLFTPFYSTKSKGMGMGLNICRSIIESHHGQLWVKNNHQDPAEGGLSAGCTFYILLPIQTNQQKE